MTYARWLGVVFALSLGCSGGTRSDAGPGPDGGSGADAGASDAASDAALSDGAVADGTVTPADAPFDGVLSPIALTPMADGDPDLVAPGRGAEFWNGVSPAPIEIPSPGATATPLDSYVRLSWNEIEPDAAGVYDFSRFDLWIDLAIDEGQRFSFGIMPVCDGCSPTTADGAGLSYPLSLHRAMQAEAVPDWIAGGVWVPNWNSESYLSRWEAFLMALAAHIATGSHAGVNYRDAIGYVDVRGYGNYGEWHVYPWYMSIPAGADATAATLIRIVDAHVAAFPDVPLVALVGAFDDGNASRMPPEVTDHVLSARNAWGPLGWRRDNFGDPGYAALLDGNMGSYMGNAFAPRIMNAWREAPIVGEPLNSSGGVGGGGRCDFYDFPAEVALYHVSSFGNGNIPDPSQPCVQDNVREASRRSGYRLVISSGMVTRTIGGTHTLVVSLDWQNVGVAPPYRRWTPTFELRDASGTVVWSAPSGFALFRFLPDAAPTTARDAFVLPSLAAGTYSLVLVVRDPSGYQAPLPLAMQGRASDGSYALGDVTVE